jgi:O-methyltransferase involved in polyketide biosynthesis
MYVSDDQSAKRVSDISQLNPDMKTIIVAEGYFDYLSPELSREQLIDLDSYFNKSSVLINTVFSLEELPKFQAFVFKSSVWMVGERLQLEKNLKEFSTILNNSGFKIIKHSDTEQLYKMLLGVLDSNLPLLRGFHILVTQNKK